MVKCQSGEAPRRGAVRERKQQARERCGSWTAEGMVWPDKVTVRLQWQDRLWSSEGEQSEAGAEAWELCGRGAPFLQLVSCHGSIGGARPRKFKLDYIYQDALAQQKGY